MVAATAKGFSHPKGEQIRICEISRWRFYCFNSLSGSQKWKGNYFKKASWVLRGIRIILKMIRSTELIKKNSNQIQSANLNVFVWGSFSKLAVFHKHHRNGRLLPFWRRTLPKLQITLLFCSPKPNFFRSHTLRHAELHPAGRLTVIEPENDVAWFRCFSFSRGGARIFSGSSS